MPGKGGTESRLYSQLPQKACMRRPLQGPALWCPPCLASLCSYSSYLPPPPTKPERLTRGMNPEGETKAPPSRWSPNPKEDISLPFKGQDTPVRVGLMLRAEEDHFLALNPSTPCHEPHPTTSSLGAAHHRCGASPDPEVVFLGMCASSASPTLYSCRWFGPSGHTLCSLLHCEPTHAPTLLYTRLSLHPASQVCIPASHCRGAPQAHPEPRGHLKARGGTAAGSCSSSGYLRA